MSFRDGNSRSTVKAHKQSLTATVPLECTKIGPTNLALVQHKTIYIATASSILSAFGSSALTQCALFTGSLYTHKPLTTAYAKATTQCNVAPVTGFTRHTVQSTVVDTFTLLSTTVTEAARGEQELKKWSDNDL